jgi:hypothetical protein
LATRAFTIGSFFISWTVMVPFLLFFSTFIGQQANLLGSQGQAFILVSKQPEAS